MRKRRDMSIASSLRLALAGLAVGFGLSSNALAQNTYLPPGFFDEVPLTVGGQAAVEADMLAYDAVNDIISAAGNVVMRYQDYVLRAEKLVYHQRTGELRAEGEVTIADTRGNITIGRDIEVTGGFKQAFVNSLTIVTSDGSLITAEQASYSSELEIMLSQAHYSPCGECIDSKGRRIGWKVNAARMVYNRDDASLTMQNPTLELLGIPVAWLPWLRLPDPSQPRATGFRVPVLDFDERMGLNVTVPYFIPIDEDTDLILSPRLMSRQGGMLMAEVTRRFANGEIDARVAATYQLEPGAYVNTVGDREWRGAIQTSGKFVPAANWTWGWTYTAFTDAAFLPDYKLTSGKNLANQVYATHLSRDYYADLRLQHFNLLGNVTPTQQELQARALPNVNAAGTHDLAEGWGQLRGTMRLLGVQRTRDHQATYNGVPYVLGHAGYKVHGTAEASWQNQVIGPAGIVVTPYLGLRADAAWYDGTSPLNPGDVSLFSATPIAALDVRWPWMAVDGLSTHLVEPVAQLVYRGSASTIPGINNDDAISFVFDDTQIFSYNRFSGASRQETGLRANLGVHYLANFEDGSWLDLIGGQSYFLAGTNSLATPDHAQTGLVTGLEDTASYFVLGARAGLGNQFTANGKLQVDPNGLGVRLATAGVRYADEDRYLGQLAYTYIPADPRIGTVNDRHEVWARAGLPIHDYWTLTGTGAWDLAQNTWLEAGVGLVYDDGFLEYGGSALITGPTHDRPNDTRFTATIRLKGPAGEYGMGL